MPPCSLEVSSDLLFFFFFFFFFFLCASTVPFYICKFLDQVIITIGFLVWISDDISAGIIFWGASVLYHGQIFLSPGTRSISGGCVFFQALSGSPPCKWFVVVLGGQIITSSCLMLLIAQLTWSITHAQCVNCPSVNFWVLGERFFVDLVMGLMIVNLWIWRQQP